MDLSIQDQKILKYFSRAKQLSKAQLQMFPHNCIGLIKSSNLKEKQQGIATGILVNSCTVLTSAHTLFFFKKGKGSTRKLLPLTPNQFCLSVHGATDQSIQIKIVDYRYPKQFKKLYDQMAKLDSNSDEYLNLNRQSVNYDYALLKLEYNVDRKIFPTLYPQFKEAGREVTVCGYLKKQVESSNREQYRQLLHSNPLEQPSYKIGGMYDIDTQSGQSGSPVYFLDDDDGVDRCNVVGIHKGYDPKLNKNICTLLSNSILRQLKVWMQEMNLAFKIRGNHVFDFPILPQPQPLIKVAYKIFQINSKILGMKENSARDINFIYDSLNSPSQLELIFRASEHGYSAKAFHQHCDNTKDTLILIHTSLGKTLAGYSHYTWQADQKDDLKTRDGQGYISVTDRDRKTFLLLVDEKVKLVPQIDNRIIVCSNLYGPIFGSGCLQIGNNCNAASNSSIAGIAGSYNCIGSDQYKWKSQETWTKVIGQIEGHWFKVSEFQVYRVHWREDKRSGFEKILGDSKKEVEKEFEDRKITNRLREFDELCINNGWKK